MKTVVTFIFELVVLQKEMFTFKMSSFFFLILFSNTDGTEVK